MHLLICPNNGGLTVARHNSVCNYLKVLIKQCCPDAVVTMEVPLQTMNEEYILADLVYVDGAVRKYIDVTIAHPGALRYRNVGSATTVDAANLLREVEKSAIYNAVEGMEGSGCFVPFAVEATGRLGSQAIKWITELTAGKDVLYRSFCLNSISSVIARYNARMIANARKRM